MKALEISNLKKTYASGVEALKGISFEVQEGDFFALLGPNGAGKSTTIGIMTSLVNKTAGHVSVFGYDIDKDLSMAKRQIGIVPQEFNFHIFETPLQIVINQAGFYGIKRSVAKARAELYLTKLGLWEKRNQPSRFLSGGMKRRLMIARALMHEPKLLILDEPTAGVDIELRRSMWAFLKEINEKGVTVILTTHYLEEAESLCRNIGIIDQGKLIVNTDMQSLLKQLNIESFILYFQEPIYELPTLEGFECRRHESNSIIVDLEGSQTITALFDELRRNHLEVTRLSNKANRLEELFLHLTTSADNHE